MKESSSSSSIRLGGAVISDRVVAALLEELRTGRYADADRLPADVAQRTNAVPLLIRGDVLVVAMMDPLDIDALDRIEIVTDREVEPVMCLRQEFTQLYAALYGHFNTMDGVMESFTALPDQPVAHRAARDGAAGVDHRVRQGAQHAAAKIGVHGRVDLADPLGIMRRVGQIDLREDHAQGGRRIAHDLLRRVPIFRL